MSDPKPDLLAIVDANHQTENTRQAESMKPKHSGGRARGIGMARILYEYLWVGSKNNADIKLVRIIVQAIKMLTEKKLEEGSAGFDDGPIIGKSMVVCYQILRWHTFFTLPNP